MCEKFWVYHSHSCCGIFVLWRLTFYDKHWEAFKRKHGAKIRSIVIKGDCGDIKKGCKLFICAGCHDVRKVPYRCKGRFCTTCSFGESED
ncbi:transposase zinc-binding domain-containing protein [Bacillus sp. B15-48]|uniref:transposase zinc-binding domain-containing protein n=1 Tax=Bacillus sp. B15-48 TaxID=1548601 RepID=UPI0031B850D6